VKLYIRSRAVDLTDELRDLVTTRIQFALDTFKDRIEDASVYLMDLNGPRGGIDKLCQVSVRAHGVAEVVVRDTGATVGSALNRAARRAKYRVAEALRQADRPSNESIRTVSPAA
jgi:putative sigma-54 modulation protein